MGVLVSGEFIGTVLLVILSLCLWFKYRFTYWSRRGVVGPKPVMIFGNLRDVMKRKSQFFEPYYDSYFKYRHLPYVGMYSFHLPVLCVIDPEIAKLVLIKDFDYFQSHGTYSEGETDPLATHMFNLHGDRWKNLRLKMSPAFSPGKLKTIYPLVESVANDAFRHLESSWSDDKSFNFTQFYETYTMEIIANIGFGIECNGFEKDNAEFFARGQEYFVPKSVYWNFIRVFAFFAPELFKQLNIRRFSRDMEDFFYGLVRETVEYRQTNSYRRNDYIQGMIDLKKEQEADGSNGFPFSMADLAANTMLYLVAGYETSATVGQLAAYELALNPVVQDTARREVEEVLRRHGGQCTYDAINEMTYLNMVLDETMRKYPPMRALFRRCNRDYRLPDGLVIERGTMVFVPAHAFHTDPEYHPDPDRFQPERFSPENKAKMHKCHWMPFGEGPRKCLGMRQGYVQVKTALVKILQRYNMELDERTPVPLKIKTTAFSFASATGIWIKLTSLDHSKCDTNNNFQTECFETMK